MLVRVDIRLLLLLLACATRSIGIVAISQQAERNLSYRQALYVSLGWNKRCGCHAQEFFPTAISAHASNLV